MRRRAVIAAGAAAALVAVSIAAAGLLHRRAAPPVDPAPAPSRTETASALVLHVPRAPASIVLDGDTDDPGWLAPPGPARTGAFLAPNGAPARPYSDARLLWGDGHLYLALYAADENVESRVDDPDGPVWQGDSFRIVFSRGDDEWSLEVSPKGVLTDAARKSGGSWNYSWNSGAHVSRDLDGTLNDPRDDDEEWVVEMAVPFESLGMKGARGESIGFAVRRCDVPKGAQRVCGAWGEQSDARGRIVLE